MMPRVSVIIPTYNRRELLREVIESLWRQTLVPDAFEIIVVDNCSEDGTELMIRGMASESPCPLRYHRMTRNLGAVRSRNTGARMAKASILAFTDSDCRVTPTWLEVGLKALDPASGGAFATGPVRNKPGQPVKFFTIGSVIDSGENPIYPTCNALYRTEVFWELGGFDEGVYLRDAGGGPIECADVDLAWRAKEAGFRNVFIEDLVVYHEVRQVSAYDWLALHYRFVQVPELIQRHPGLRKHLLWWGPFCLMGNLFFYVAVFALVLAVLLNPWFVMGVLPFVVNALGSIAPKFSPKRIPKLLPQFAFLATRQALICGALIYGSIRARRLVL